MPTNDIRSNLLPKLAFKATISSNTTTNGAIIDTADFDGGVVFTLFCSAYTDGTYTPVLEESDDSGMSGANNIDDANLIGTEAGAVMSAVDAQGDTLASIGCVGTKRYIRLKITSASTSSGATILATFHGKGEVLPDANLSA